MTLSESFPADGTRQVISANARIAANGRLHIGEALDLTQRPQVAGFTLPRFAVGRPEDGTMAAIDDNGVWAPPGMLPAQQLGYSFVDTGEEIYIENRGLTASYGIFGAPGSGKTHLLLYLLRQALELDRDDEERKFGALILDPKSALVEDVRDACAKAGREADLVIINTEELELRDEYVNIIDCALDPHELGRALVLAAQSAGAAASEPFWFGAWSNLFGSALYLLDWLGEDIVTLDQLVTEVLYVDGGGLSAPERRIQRRAREARDLLAELPPDRRRDAEFAINQIEGYYRQEAENVATVETLISRAYSGFQMSRWQRYSPRQLKPLDDTPRTTFYDQIIDDGKIVLVSVSPSDPGMAKTICTLVKCLFQQSVLSRLARVRAGTLRNFTRPVLLACDEYSGIASEVPGEPMGDGHFFSLSRQNGCMALIATQSVNMLQSSSLKDAWRAVFSNFAAKIFMRLADNETAEEAMKLVGEMDWYMGSSGISRQKDGMGSSSQRELRERKSLPTSVLTQVIGLGQGVVVGALDGGQPSLHFVRVPPP